MTENGAPGSTHPTVTVPGGRGEWVPWAYKLSDIKTRADRQKNECLLDNNMTIDTLVQQATDLRGQKLRMTTLQTNLLRQLVAIKQQVATVQKASRRH